MRDKTEAKIQQEIFMYLKNNYCLLHHDPKCVIFSVPNDSSSKEETMRKLATGMLPGASDMIFVRPNEVLFIEVKTDTGTQQPNQKEFKQSVEKLGFRYVVWRSKEDAIQWLNNNQQ